MNYKKISNGIYKAENGMTIKKHTFKNIFTGGVMSEAIWDIYDINGTRIDYTITLKQAKEVVEGKNN